MSEKQSDRIGFWMAVALVMGNMIGSGIFLLPSSLAPYGGIGLLGWLVSAVGSILLALVFARMSRISPLAGGPYAFTRQGFGDLAGFLVAWGYWLSVCCGNAAIAIACVGYLTSFLPPMARQPAIASTIAAGMVWLLTAVNIWGVREAGRVQVVTTVLKILPLILISIAAVTSFTPAPFAIVDTGARTIGSHLSIAAAMTFFAFGGLESATIPAGHIADPERTIPRATILGTMLTAVVYIVSTIGVMSVVPVQTLKTSTAPFADAARIFAGDRAAVVIAAGAAISSFGALNGWILIAGQVPLAIATDKLFPRIFARLSARGTPAHALVLSSLITTTLIVFNGSRGLVDLFTFLVLLGTLNSLVPYAFSSLALLLIDPATKTRGSGDRSSLILVASLAFAYSLWMIAGSGMDVVYWGFLLLLAGLPLYVWVARQAPQRTAS